MSTWFVNQSAAGVSVPMVVFDKDAFWAGNGGLSLILNFTGTTNPTTGAASGAAASATVTVQISNDPLALTAPNSARWIAHPVLTGITTDASSAQEFVCVAIRLNITTYVSGTVQLAISRVNGI
jgi:hypothetical protein